MSELEFLLTSFKLTNTLSVLSNAMLISACNYLDETTRYERILKKKDFLSVYIFEVKSYP